jgi:bla regulator protein BlaR1
MMHSLVMDIGFLNPALQAFCLMLVHSLWLGLLLIVATGLVVACTRKASSVTRYNLLAGLLGIFLVACGYMFIDVWRHTTITTATSFAQEPVMDLTWHDAGYYLQTVMMQFCTDYAGIITATWLFFFSIKCWQMAMAFRYVRRIRTTQQSDAGDYWNKKMQALAQQLQIKKTVLLLESAVTKIPVVIGHLKPVIYMPVGLLANLPPDQVEAVLLHELAHIRRRDYLVNLLQHVAETIFFFNPGLLWLCSLLKREREYCCDDIALKQVRKKKPFIQALVSFKEYATSGAYTMAFPGTRNHLLQRVTRIINNRNTSLTIVERIFFTGSVVMLMLFPGVVGSHQKTTEANMPLVAAEAAPAAPTLPKPPVVIQPEEKPALPVKISKRKTERAARRKTVTPAQQPTPEKDIEPVETNQREPSHEEQEMALIKKARLQQELHKQIAEIDRERAEEDRRRADIDRERAHQNRARAEEDRRFAMKAHQQAIRDRERAEKDRRQAERHREQAERDRQRANEDRVRADVDRREADRNRVRAEERERKRTDEDRRSADQRHDVNRSIVL